MRLHNYRKKLRKWIIVVAILIILIELLTLSKSRQEDNFDEKYSSDFSPCNYIDVIDGFSNSITIVFKPEIPKKAFDNALNHFFFETKLFDELLLADYNSFTNISSSQVSYSFDIILPAIEIYQGFLLCFNNPPKINNRARLSIATKTKYKYPLELVNDDFVNTNYSQMRCFGENYASRWCDMRKIAIYKNLVTFSTPVYYNFPSPFLLPGARGPPYDRPGDRFHNEPVVTHKIFNSEDNFTNINSLSYIIGRFYNSMMLWHILFDFAIPAYNTIQEIEGEQMKNHENSRLVFFHDDEYNVFTEFGNIFSKIPTRRVDLVAVNLTLRRAIVGMRKFESNLSPYRKMEEMINFRYEFNRSHGYGFREFVMRQMNVTEKPINPNNPEIILISRKGTGRDITNSQEIYDFLVKQCPYCNVRVVDLKMLKISQQISLFASASAMVGLHGSGLTHVLWMPPNTQENPTAMFEIKPYNYWCRDWYEVAANVAAVGYVSVMNKHAPIYSDKDWFQNMYCYSFKQMCKRLECHDFIRDKQVTLEIEAFKEAWLPFQKKLDEARK